MAFAPQSRAVVLVIVSTCRGSLQKQGPMVPPWPSRPDDAAWQTVHPGYLLLMVSEVEPSGGRVRAQLERVEGTWDGKGPQGGARQVASRTNQ